MVATLRPDESDLVYPLGLSIGWAFVGSGLLVRGAGAGDRLGSVLVLAGIAFFAGGLQLSGNEILFTFGTMPDSCSSSPIRTAPPVLPGPCTGARPRAPAIALAGHLADHATGMLLGSP